MRIIALEGPDRLGKTTQAKLLAKAIDAKYIKFPNEDIYSGRVIRLILKKVLPFEPASFQALQIINRLETFKLLDPTGTYVFDRYKLSGIVYGLADNLKEDWIRDVCNLLPDPDITLVFRGVAFGKDIDIYSGKEYQERITELYSEETQKLNGQVHWVESTGSKEEIHTRILEMITPLFFSDLVKRTEETTRKMTEAD